MSSRREVLAAGLAIAASLVAPGAFAEEPTPEAHMKGLYARITAGKGDSGGQQYWTEPKVRARFFSAALVKTWAKAEAKAKASDDVGPIDFDPFTNSQDPQVKSVAIERLDDDGPLAKVRVTLQGGGQTGADGKLVFDLIKEAGAWKIDNVYGSGSGDPWNLRALLSMQ